MISEKDTRQDTSVTSNSKAQAGETKMTETKGDHIELFSIADLTGLREELMKSGLDSWQAADLISSFLAARGYGVSTQDARLAASRMDAIGCSLKCLQAELEKLAHVM
jgi:hypothetical protein